MDIEALIGSGASADKGERERTPHGRSRPGCGGRSSSPGCSARASPCSSRTRCCARSSTCRRRGSCCRPRWRSPGLLVAVLAAVRFSVDGRRVDLLLASGFFVTSLSAAVFAIGPLLGGAALQRPEGWAALLGGIVGGGLVAVAPFLTSRTPRREWAIANAVAAAGIVMVVVWMLLRARRRLAARTDPGSRRDADVRADLDARGAGADRPRRRDRLGPAAREARRRPRPLARARPHAAALRRAAPRLHTAAGHDATSPRATSCASSPTE